MTTTSKTAIVVMGVAGSGKSTIAELLARELGWTTIEADDLHSPASVAKMAAGIPLDDSDREPWLRGISDRINDVDGDQVLTCSALKRRYRDILRTADARVRFLHLDGGPDLIGGRIGARTGHFMPPELLDSQFDALEPLEADEDGVSVPIDGTPDDILRRAITGLQLDQDVPSAAPQRQILPSHPPTAAEARRTEGTGMAVINDPSQLHAVWAERFNAQDVDGLLDLCEPGFTFVPHPGAATTGGDARAALEQFLALGLPIQMSVRHVYVHDDLVLAVVDWTLQGTTRDGSEVAMSGSTADLARRGGDGWKFVIDNPFGTA